MHSLMRDPSLPVFEAQTWINAGKETPFVFLNGSSGATQAKGTPNAFVGHRMTVPGDPRSHGMFAQWSWDGETLQAQVDPLGYFTLFVYAKDGQLGVSPSILRLLEHGADPAPDPVALAVFHRLGFFVDGDTPFAHIQALPPGGRLTWKHGKLDIQGKPVSPGLRNLSRDQAVEAIIEIPRAAIRRFVEGWQGPIGLPLSGGRDSRHILLEMVRQRRKPDTCVTFHHGGRAHNAEVQAARAVAARAGVHHTVLGHPRMRLRDSLRGILMTQLCSDEHAQMMPMHDFLSDMGASHGMAAIDGIGGDILTNPDDSAAEFMALSRMGDYESIARRLAAGHARVISRPWHQGGAGALLSADLEEAAIARIADAIRAHDHAPDPYQAFWFWNRTRREISFVSTGVMGGAAMVFCPYLDLDMVDLGLSLPWSVTQDQMLHDDAIGRAFPDCADIPFAEGFRSRKTGSLRLRRLASLLDSLIVSARVDPPLAMQTLAGFLRSMPLERGPCDIYRLHSAMVSSMNARQAGRLLDLGAQLRETSMKKAVVSEIFTPD